MAKALDTMVVVGCAAIVMFPGTTYHTLVVDGTLDFSADEVVSGTSESTWYFTSDADALCLGEQNPNVGSNSSAKWLYWYIDSDPQLLPLQGSGTQTGLMHSA